MVAGGAAVAAPAGAAEPPAQDWTDTFDGTTLDPRWEITSEVPSAWSLTSNEGALTLTSQTGDTYQTANSAKNVFMVDIPDGDFTAVTTVHAPVSKVYQGAGLIAWSDMDNYVRAGLTFVGSLSPSGRAIETDVESGGAFSAVDFEDRVGSEEETLRLQRTGDTLTTSYWDGTDWVVAATTTLSFDITAVGLYALAAQDGTTHQAVFDSFGVTASEGADQVPSGPFTLHADGGPRYLVSDDGALALTDARPTNVLGLVATEGDAGALTLRTRDGDLPVVVDGDHLAVGAAGDDAAPLRLTDAGGGKLVLRLADGSAYVGLGDGGVLTLGPLDDAVYLTVEYQADGEGVLAIDGDATAIDISDDLYGIFYEDINYAADGGLYAELVRNRSFEFNSSDNASFTGMTAWETVNRDGATGTTASVVTDGNRLNDTNRYYLRLGATAGGSGVRNASYNNGVAVEAGEKYDFSVWARTTTAQTLTVQVENAAGTTVVAGGTVDVDGSDAWKKYSVTLTADATTDAGRLAVLAGATSTLRLDMVSLFPQDTWVGAVNGKSVLRKDLAEKIAALDPSFVRFPGGCVTNVGTFKSYAESGYVDRRRTYQWKETIGPVEERATNYNFWGYNQSYGIGYLEYFELAEDLGATPLPVLSVGANGCGSTVPEMKDPALIQRWVDDTVDLIEFANGDVDTEWGAVRAELGHPEPFHLRYIGLGNEENTTTFEANFPKFKAAVEAAYPDVQIISNSGPDDTGSRFDTLWKFNREQDVDLVDEHYYNDPDWFLTNNDRYDSYDREGPAVFLGEYASKGNTMWNALAEASYMTAIERNSDVVKLASYAPLLANESYVQWSPDAIWYDNDESWGSVNYYVQKLFSTNKGDQVVPSTYEASAEAVPNLSGGVFLSTWSTAATYDDLVVTDNDTDDVLFSDDFDDASQWTPQAGTWAVSDGKYRQSSTSVTDARTVPTGAYDEDWDDYTLELKATKTAGSEGFLVGFAATGSNNYYWWNVGGWNNTRQALQKAAGGSANEVAAVENSSVVTGQEYDLKVVVDGRHIELYLDGELQMEYDDEVPADVYQVVTRDISTGDVVVKVVNTSDTAQRTRIQTSDVEVADEATAIEIVGQPGDTNTKANPEKLVPVERTISGVSQDFAYDFPAYSITFLRLHTPDTEDPTIASIEADGTPVKGYLGQPTTVTVTAEDDREVASVEVAVDGGAWTTHAGGTVDVTVSGDGSHSVQARAVDAAGNVSAVETFALTIDATAPVSNATVDAAARTVTLRAADSGAGVARIEYRTASSGPWSVYGSAVTVGSAQTTVWFRAVDALGNVEVAGSVVVPKKGVTLAATTTTGIAQPSTVRYGAKRSVAVAVAGVAGSSGTPTGTVRVLDGSRLVGTGTLSGGRATVAVRTDLAVGTHRLTVSYGGDARFAASSSTVKLVVTKTSTTTKVTTTSPRATAQGVATAKVTTATGVRATGKVTFVVTKGGKVVATRTAWLRSTGTATATLPRLPAGSYTVKATYAGSGSATASSGTKTLVVRR
ncbi:Ig-like domain repeat protein [Cellulomonas sp. DKR-3]|uniref:non-reducing end alpha-L-arabinofuranosidase n=1 Tax=Cellulomonas fulva TaxID=2835530 RepID=A0ABS5TYJ1_9CELL|nr:alpha-L-arabinofuranosidase C-terminal domain-containing protein [Cellulomonas fulva]MBT0994194.1 Ig-like domain repeat protein [Cellulomonas fulva]